MKTVYLLCLQAGSTGIHYFCLGYKFNAFFVRTVDFRMRQNPVNVWILPNWKVLTCLLCPQGEKGDTGPTGAAGAQGAPVSS